MLFFGYIIDKIGRRTGIVFATLFLVLGIILATAAHGVVSLESDHFKGSQKDGANIDCCRRNSDYFG